MSGKLFHEKVSWMLSIACIGSFTLGAGLIIWQTAFNENPVANAFATALASETQLQ